MDFQYKYSTKICTNSAHGILQQTYVQQAKIEIQKQTVIHHNMFD